MGRYGRESLGQQLDVVPIVRPFSNFSFIDKEFDGLWPLRRIFSQIRLLGGRTMVVEELDPDRADDLKLENEDVAKRYGSVSQSRVRRLSFFTKPFKTRRGMLSATDDQFLGYAIIKNDAVPGLQPKQRIFESVILPSRHMNNFVRGGQKWQCQVGGERFAVQGYLYAQQNDMTNSCAHVACRTAAARYHPTGDMTYREMNNLPGVQIDHSSRTTEGGLTSQQMIEILEASGARCVVGDYTAPKTGFMPPPFHKYIYGSIESGCPVIVCFATTKGDYHAIPVFGHTFNEDTWAPNAEWSYFQVGQGTTYTPSDSWLSMYIAHDDNWGSNFCIPRRLLYAKRLCQNWPGGAKLCEEEFERVAYVIATFPKVVKVNAIDAEVIAADFLFSMLGQLPPLSEAWDKRLSVYAQANMLVLRPVLIDSRDYADHLSKTEDWEGARIHSRHIRDLKSISAQKLWMVEMSIPELFSANRRKVAEILIKAEVTPGGKRDFKNFLIARLPSYFVLYKSGGPSNPQYGFVPSGVHSHISLYGCED